MVGREPLAKSYVWTKCVKTRIWFTGAMKLSFHIRNSPTARRKEKNHVALALGRSYIWCAVCVRPNIPRCRR